MAVRATQTSAALSRWFMQDAGSRKHAWFFRGFGFAVLMLIGVAAWKYLPLLSDAQSPSGSETPSGHLPAFAFIPSVPGVRTGGLRGSLGQKASSMPVGRPLRLSMQQEGAPALSRRDVLRAGLAGLAIAGGSAPANGMYLGPIDEEEYKARSMSSGGPLRDKDDFKALTNSGGAPLTAEQKARLESMRGTMERMNDLTPLQRQQVMEVSNSWANDLNEKQIMQKPGPESTRLYNQRLQEMSHAQELMKDLTPLQRQELMEMASPQIDTVGNTKFQEAVQQIKNGVKVTPKQKQEASPIGDFVPLPKGMVINKDRLGVELGSDVQLG